ncbi:MAG TPA: hypothetical protein H9694_04135 [Firmicutes bacterium]|nr:hypothetical protein [Bacillota bacterium]
MEISHRPETGWADREEACSQPHGGRMEAAAWQPRTQAHSGRFAQGGPKGSASCWKREREQDKTGRMKSEGNG